MSKEAYYVVLEVYNIPSESSNGWKDVFQHLKSRGLNLSGLFICDELSGIQDAILDEFTKSRVQFCTVHKKRNVLLKVRSKDKKIIAEELKQIFPGMYDNSTKQESLNYLHDFVNKWGKIYPALKPSLIDKKHR